MNIPVEELQGKFYQAFGIIVDKQDAVKFATWIIARNNQNKSDFDKNMDVLRDLGLA